MSWEFPLCVVIIQISVAVLILTPTFGEVGATSAFPKSKVTLGRVAVQARKVGKGLLCPDGVC